MDCKIAAVICAMLLSATLIQGAAIPRGNRCLCTKFSKKLKLKTVEKLEIYPRSSTCENIEYVVFLKKRNVPICVDPDLKEIKVLLRKKNRQPKIQVIRHQ